MLPGMTAAQAAQMDRRCNELVLSLFPQATQMELYGAAIHLDRESLEPIAVTCGGVTKGVERA